MQKQRIAIIGSGISGLTCGYLLNDRADITLYEAGDYLGGHTATKDIEIDGQEYAIDTGFIVFNDWTYPNFIKLLDKIGVKKQATEMSFSVRNNSSELEYNGHSLNTLFAQRRNLLSPRFYRLIREILRFNDLCKQTLNSDLNLSEITLTEFLQKHGFSDYFAVNYILPMCAAIWSASLETAGNFPLAFFLKFFNNHGLLNVNDRPQWYTIVGGSREYVGPLAKEFSNKIKLSTPVKKVTKTSSGLIVTTDSGDELFDDVIFACHSDQALQLLDVSSLDQALSKQTTNILGAIPYALNDVILHTDVKVLPKRRLAWASWNYQLQGTKNEREAPAKVSYNMNILQRLQANRTFIVTLNDRENIDPEKILGQYEYAHPQFSPKMVAAQQQRAQICGVQGIHYCGAYWYNGFHEDGVRSALDVCKRFGAHL
ncbi:NAD(P)/FAD-dependent oxidoreductase [Glaciecola sp. 1036]|uniref:NAD(P)/FAD-dependent oxidoreductase n=1 Tax=Alteromonadaceae TaxID=72275 RepID=UPI003D08C996